MKPREIILQAKLSEVNGDKNSFCFSEGHKDFESAVRSLLVTELPQEMREIFGIEISVEIKAVREGSLVVFFGVVIAGIGALSRYKNLYDSVELVRSQADRALCSLKKRFGEFRVDVSTLQPRFQNPYDRHPFFKHEKKDARQIVCSRSLRAGAGQSAASSR